MLAFDLSDKAIQTALHFAETKQATVGAGGGHWTIKTTEHKSKHERQVTGMLGEIAVAIAVMGENNGILRFATERKHRDANPAHHDGGNDLFQHCDIKTRRLQRNKAFYSRFIQGDILNYELIIRPKHVYPNKTAPRLSHRYVHVIVEYPDTILECGQGGVYVWVVGWSSFRRLHHFPDGKPGIANEHWSLTGHEMLPMKSFSRIPQSMVKALPHILTK